MPLDPGIILATNPVQAPPDPVNSAAKLMALRGAVAENALRQQQVIQSQAQTQDIQAQADQRRRQLADQNTLQDLLKDPDSASKIFSGDVSPLNGKVSPDYQSTIAKNMTALHEQRATASKTDLENSQNALGTIADTVNGWKQLGDVARINEAIPDGLQRLTANGTLANAGIDPNKVPRSISSIDDLDTWAAHIGAKQALDKAAADLKEKQSKPAQTESEIQKNIGAAAESNAKAAHQTLVDQMMKDAQAGIQNGTHPIDAILPATLDPTANASFKASYDTILKTAGPEAAKTVVEAAANHAAALSPTEVQKDVNKAVAVEKATSPLKVQQQVSAARALREGDNPAMAGVPPAQAAATQSAAIKLDQDYAKAKAQADSIKTVLDLAAQGNKAAGANAPLVGVGAVNAVNGIKRINSAEIAQYGTAGSLVDKIQGKLQGWQYGQPIPKDVLDDMQKLHDELRSTSYEQYSNGLRSLNQRSGAKLAPAFDPPKKAASTGYNAGDTRVVGGHTYKRDDGGVWHLQP